MRDLAAIASVYTHLDALLEQSRTNARERDDTATVGQIAEKQRINDQAYFILCWGQLEAEIDEACRSAIRRRVIHSTRDVRRGWDLYNPDDKRLSGLSFEDRVALVVDRTAGSGSPWAKITSYYALRNQIAHGKLRPQRIDVSAVVRDFYTIQGAFEP